MVGGAGLRICVEKSNLDSFTSRYTLVECSMTTGTYYDRLGCSPGASASDLKRAYMARVLELHPDKGAGAGAAGRGNNREAGEGDAFIALHEAWEVLRDESRRKEYDLQLRVAAQHACLDAERSAEVDIDDLEFSQSRNLFLHRCRCGDTVEVPVSSLDRGEEVFGCDSCSLSVRVLYELELEPGDQD